MEATKLSFKNGDEKEKDRAVSVLLNVLEESLRLLHPYIPFVTEEIYLKIPLEEIVKNRKASGAQKILPDCDYTGLLVNAPYPLSKEERKNRSVTERFETLQELIRNIRALRVECGIDPASKINIAVHVEALDSAQVIKEKTDMICLLAGLKNIDFVESKPASSIGTIGRGFEAFVLVDENVNRQQLLDKFTKEAEKESAYAKRIENKLNGSFSQHAPKEVVEEEKKNLEEIKRRIEKLGDYIKSL